MNVLCFMFFVAASFCWCHAEQQGKGLKIVFISVYLRVP